MWLLLGCEQLTFGTVCFGIAYRRQRQTSGERSYARVYKKRTGSMAAFFSIPLPFESPPFHPRPSRYWPYFTILLAAPRICPALRPYPYLSHNRASLYITLDPILPFTMLSLLSLLSLPILLTPILANPLPLPVPAHTHAHPLTKRYSSALIQSNRRPDYCLGSDFIRGPRPGIGVTLVPCSDGVTILWDIDRGAGTVRVAGGTTLVLDARANPGNFGFLSVSRQSGERRIRVQDEARPVADVGRGASGRRPAADEQTESYVPGASSQK